jgi:hypothetical protein
MFDSRLSHWVAIAAMAASPGWALAQAVPDGSSVTTETRSAEGFESQRAAGALRDAQLLRDPSATPRRIPRGSKLAPESNLKSAAVADAWIYDATAELFHDFDGDGYFHYLRVRFDADNVYANRYVYARLYLSDDGEWWQEYHVTRDFMIDGTSPYDDYEVETELAAGFPPGLYDVMIELYDADYGDFLADFGPAESSALALLPIEDSEWDRPPPPPVVVVTHEHGGGGALDWPLLVLLGGLGVLVRMRGRGPAAPAELGRS